MGRGVPVGLIVDAGVLFANIDVGDRHHDACAALLQAHPGPLLVPQLVIAEVAYLTETRLGPEPEIRLLEDLATGVLVAEPVSPGDWLRIAELVWRYRDLALGTVDGSAIALAERLGVTTVATLDRRHFGAVRPVHTEAFELLP